MAGKFVQGLVFGAGFAISYVVISTASALWVFPRLVTSQLSEADQRFGSTAITSHSDAHSVPPLSGDVFSNLGVNDRIKQATVIALARFERAPDGQMRAVIKEFLKQAPNARINYRIGDEFPDASYYPTGNEDHGDGAVIFFTGSPAQMTMSETFKGDRIAALGDLPVELLRAKCQRPGT